MLILSRKKNECIVIGDSIKIFVVQIRRGEVQLGIDAPKETPVHREEIFDAIKREEEQKRE
jgi:carbon storage regulator